MFALHWSKIPKRMDRDISSSHDVKKNILLLLSINGESVTTTVAEIFRFQKIDLPSIPTILPKITIFALHRSITSKPINRDISPPHEIQRCNFWLFSVNGESVTLAVLELLTFKIFYSAPAQTILPIIFGAPQILSFPSPHVSMLVWWLLTLSRTTPSHPTLTLGGGGLLLTRMFSLLYIS